MTEIGVIIALGAVLASAFLIKRFVPAKKLRPWTNVTNAFGAIATGFSLAFGALTYYRSEQLQKELSASGIYQDHMKISIEHPNLANGTIAPKPPAEAFPPDKDKDGEAYKKYIEETEAFEKYRWYVGHALYSFESIFDALPGDPAWETTFQGLVVGHTEYICGDEFDPSRYSDGIRRLLEKTLKNLNLEKLQKTLMNNEKAQKIKEQCSQKQFTDPLPNSLVRFWTLGRV